jgi:CSLREA domain-containing protein
MSPRFPIIRFCVILLIAATLIGAGPRRAFSGVIGPGGVITVDSFLDIDDNLGNSVCSAGIGHPTDGPCTLRAAIFEANQNVPSQNIIIKLPAGEYNLTIPPNYLNDNDTHSGDLNLDFPGSTITNTVTIEPLSGGPVVIRSLIEDRVLSTNIHARVILNNLTLRDGNVFQDINNNPSAGGGAIHSKGTLTLNGVSLLSNTVRCRPGYNCAAAGGAIENWGNITIQDSTLDGNTALQGGAIWHAGTPPKGNLNISYSTLSNNHSSYYGTIANYANLTIFNSTFSGNSSEFNTLSGIYNSGILNMRSTTMANVGDYSAIYNANGSSSPLLRDNIFKKEPGYANCVVIFGSTLTSGGYNIANDESCNLSVGGDLMNTDPLLGSFGNWGGPTKTIMLNPGSPALNHRKDKCWFSSNFLIDDQRHWPRSDGQCDTGAYEFSPWYLYLPVITK